MRHRIIEGGIYPTNTSGDLIVKRIYNHSEVAVRFLKTGYEAIVRKDSIIKGRVKDKLLPRVYGVGYTGEGDYLTNQNRKKTPAYGIWEGMLRRCYNPDCEKNWKTYGARGVIVCDEWHNFQNFAEWFYHTRPEGEDWQMDKDALSGDTKIYSPETVRWVTQLENAVLSQKDRIKPINIYECDTNKLIAENVSAYMWAKENGYEQSPLSKSARSDHTKPHHHRTNPWRYRGIYAVYV